MLKEFKMIGSSCSRYARCITRKIRKSFAIFIGCKPIGRRSLSETMGITERVLRTETDCF